MRWTDINKLMWVFEANYDRLMLLAPDIESIRGDATSSVLDARDLHLQVVDSSRYTTTVTLTQYLNLDGVLVPNPHMRIRLYHDAKVAEVVAYQNQTHFKHRYAYPNPKMMQRHEKRAVNQFLAEWLTHCIALGYRFNGTLSHTQV
jgi:uncharacterized protein YqiB (DUF1249 family)